MIAAIMPTSSVQSVLGPDAQYADYASEVVGTSVNATRASQATQAYDANRASGVSRITDARRASYASGVTADGASQVNA